MTTENNKTETARRDGRLRDIRKAHPHGIFFLLIRPQAHRRNAKKALPHRRKHRSAPQKKLFRHTEKPVSHGGKASLATLEKDFDYVGQYILLCISRICKTPKSRVFAAESMSARKNGGIFALRCIFIHAPMYIYAYFHVHLFIHQYIFARIRAADGTACCGFSSASRQHERRRSTDSPL